MLVGVIVQYRSSLLEAILYMLWKKQIGRGDHGRRKRGAHGPRLTFHKFVCKVLPFSLHNAHFCM